MSIREDYGVTEVFSLLLVITIATTAISAVLFWAIPQMEQNKDSVLADSSVKQFKTISDVIKDVSNQGASASGLVDFVTDKGNFYLDSRGERFVFYYSLNTSYDFNVSGLGDSNDKQFNFQRVRGIPDSFRVYYLYTGASGSSSPEVVPISNPITVSNNLADAIRIDVINSSSIVGRIWLFDSGCVSYDLYSSDTYKVRAENGGVVSVHNNVQYLTYEPDIQKNDEMLVMNMIQLKPGNLTAGSGSNKYTLFVKSNETNILENRMNICGPLKMQIYGDYNDSWIDYFTSWQGFKEYPGRDILHSESYTIFTLVQKICDITLVVE